MGRVPQHLGSQGLLNHLFMVEVEKVEKNEVLTSSNVVVEKIIIKSTKILAKRCDANTLKRKRNWLLNLINYAKIMVFCISTLHFNGLDAMVWWKNL
jgi:hypothetical protein